MAIDTGVVDLLRKFKTKPPLTGQSTGEVFIYISDNLNKWSV